MVLRSLRSRLRLGVFPSELMRVRGMKPGIDDYRDEDIIEALKSKKFKVITITHGTYPLQSSDPDKR